MRRSSLTRLLTLFAVCIAFEGRATTIPEIIAKAKPAVVQVIASNANWSPIRTGTGFFVSADGELLTNFHVIQGATHISARTNKGAIFVFEKPIAGSADSDVALLKFQATDVDFLKLGSSANAVEGETVLVIGNPEGLQGTVSDGIISAFRENRSYIQITAPISPGSSGSPVLDESGQVIGMATLLTKEGQNLNFAISTEVVKSAMDEILTQEVLNQASSPQPVVSNVNAAPSAGVNQSPQTFDDYIHEGYVAYEDRDYKRSVEAYTKAIVVQPNSASLYFKRARSYDALSNYTAAIADYGEAIRLKSADVFYVYLRRANDHSNLKHYSAAIADYTSAIKTNTYADSYPYICRAQLYQQQGNHSRALADYNEAVRIRPNEGSYGWRGRFYAETNEYNKAVIDLSECLRSDPDNPAWRYWRGLAHAGLRQYDEAIADYDVSIAGYKKENAFFAASLKELHPFPPSEVYYHRGLVFSALKQYRKAIDDYSEAIKTESDVANNANAYEYRGEAYQAIGDVERAGADFKTARQLGFRKN
jgi:tetratricopeptide (TPR) repeat protein